jgi:endonuclease/exonuclease/phosphatase family metal-dependent hydrolase
MVKVATFNVENLFGRAKAINLVRHESSTEVLGDIGKLQDELKKPVYDKPEIIRLYKKVKDYVKFNVVRSDVGFYIVYRRNGVWTVTANGKKDWDGFLEHRRDKFSSDAQRNTAWVIKDIKPDVLCLVEVENLPVLRNFNTDLLGSRYPYKMLIDALDPRGIDVGLYSNYEFDRIWTNMYDKGADGKRIFSRDCLEVEVMLPSGDSLFVLLNHFKSKYGSSTDPKRQKQAEGVAKILKEEYDLKREYVIVMGDLNDTPDRPPLQPLLGLRDLYDVLEEEIPDPADRWTYHYTRNEQIDYLLVSKPLQRLKSAGVERRGMAYVDEYSNGEIEPIEEDLTWRTAASDHGAVWAEFDI